MKSLKKLLTIVSLVSLSIVVILLIGAIFGLKVFQEGILLQLLLSCAILTFACSLSISSIGFFDKNKGLSLACILSLSILTLFGLIIVWFKILFDSPFTKITLVLGIISIFFNIIASQYINLGKRFKAVQIITYIIIGLLDILLTLLILGVKIFDIKGIPQAFAVICILVVAMLIVLAILSRKVKTGEKNTTDKQNTITIEKSEYDLLVSKVEELEKENAELKEKLLSK